MIVFPDARIAFCSKHLEPFRVRWPKGYVVLCTTLMQHVLADNRFANKMEPAPDPMTSKISLDEKKASEVLVEVSPLCCFIGDDLMTLITDQALDRKRGNA